MEAQQKDIESNTLRARLIAGEEIDGWAVPSDGSIRLRGRVFVPRSDNLRDEVLREFHQSRVRLK